MAVNVHVAELVLHGVRPSDRLQVGEVLRAELTHLLADRTGPLFRQPATFERVVVPSVHVAPGAGPTTIGRHLARAVYSAMGAAGQ